MGNSSSSSSGSRPEVIITSSVWRTTLHRAHARTRFLISIHVLRVEDDFCPVSDFSGTVYFNPRPPCGGRLCYLRESSRRKHFNPRPPCGGRQVMYDDTASHHLISIHVLRVEDDVGVSLRTISFTDFNPRPPCGGRHLVCGLGELLMNFNPRPPCGGRQSS